MKTAIICAICEKPKKYSDSYALKLTDYRLRPDQRATLEVTKKETITSKVRVCRTCTRRMGYKVKAGVSPIKKKL